MNNKKILFLAMWFLPRIGGMEMSSNEIVKMIQSMHADVWVITTDYETAQQYDKAQSFVIRRAKGTFLQNLASKNKIKRIYYYCNYYHKYFLEVKKAIKEFQPDEVIVADEQTRNWFGFYAHKIAYNPIVVASMPEKKEETIKIKIISRTLRKAKAIYCVSNSTKEKMLEAFGDAFRPKMHVLYRSIGQAFLHSAVDQDAVNALKTRYNLQNKFVLLSVCRLNQKKGVGEVIAALHQLRDQAKDIALLICGEGPDRQRLEEMAKQYGLEKNIFFCGKIDKEDITNYYDACDIFVLPSVEESFGRVYAEAGARRKMSIGCNIGGVAEVIDDGKTGCLIEPEKIDMLAELILKFKTDALLRNGLANRMYKKVQEQFSFEALAIKWREILKAE